TSETGNSTNGEQTIVSPPTPSIATTVLPATVGVGGTISDKATVSGGFNPTGTVTFNLFNNPNAIGSPLFTDTEPLSGGMATSASFTTTGTGTFYWMATYNGDSNNGSVTSGSADEPVNVVDANIQITPLTPVNEVNHAETFTVTVTAFP